MAVESIMVMNESVRWISTLPESIQAFLHYSNVELSTPAATNYYRHVNLMSLSFLVVRIIGYALLARWLFRGGAEVAELLTPSAFEEQPTQG